MATVIKPKRSETALAVPAANALAVGELAVNVTDGKFYTKTTSNVVKDILLDGSNLVFEGFLANAYETTLTAQEPTVDRTITLPNITGTVITTGNLTVDGTPTGDVLVGEGDSLAFSIVFGS